MKSQWFADEKRKQFAALLHEADYSRHSYENFGTFLDCSSTALRQAVHQVQTGKKCRKIEDEYMAAIGRVKHPKNMAHAMGVLVEALEEKPYDFLGVVMGEWGINDKKWAGQCFTPTDLCRMIAKLTFGEEISPDPDNRLSILEPACGGGAMVIAAADHLKSRGFYPWNYWFHMVDVDPRCAKMAYVQCTLLGIPAWVITGNSISLEVRCSWPTLAMALHPLRSSALPAEPAPVHVELPPAHADASDKPRQLALF